MNALKPLAERALFLKIILLVLFTALTPLAAHAGGMDEPADPAKIQFILENYQCPAGLTGITNRAVECIRELLNQFSNTSFVTVLSKLSKAVAAVMMIFVALTGMKVVLGGVRNQKAEAFMVFFKLVVVGFLALSLDGYGTGTPGLKMMYDMANDMSEGLVEMVGDNFSSSAGQCSQGKIWERTDCIIMAFIGQQTDPDAEDKDGDGKVSLEEQVKKTYVDSNCNGVIDEEEKTADNQVYDITLFGFATSQFFTPHGIFVLILIVVAALMMAFTFAIGLFVFVIAMVALTFLFLLGPVFIPLFLFQKTKRMFLSWVAQIVNYVIQPALMVGFLSFLIAVMNVTLFGDGTQGNQGLKGTMDTIRQEMEGHQCTKKTLIYMSNAMMADVADRAVNEDQTAQRPAGEQMGAKAVSYVPVSYKLLSVFIVQLLAAIVLLYIMLALLKNVGEIAGQLSAGTGGSLARFVPGTSKASGMAKDFSRGAVKE